MRPDPVVSLYTDAGVKDGVATWATVAIIPGLSAPIEASGRMRDKLDCASTAELRAIANALHSLLKAGHISRGSAVRVFTDSRHAVDRINGQLTKKPESLTGKAFAAVSALATAQGVELSASWVKGHQRLDSPDRHAVHNRRCDALCTAARGPKKPAAKKAAPKAATPPKKVKATIVQKPPTNARKALEIARQLESGA